MIPAYFSLSKSPRYSLTFALPLLVIYELMANAIQGPTGGLRNGADVMLKALFSSVAGPSGPLIFSALLVITIVALAVRDVRRNPGGLRARVFLLMLVESAALALLLGFVVGLITAQLVTTFTVLSIGQRAAPGTLGSLGWPTALTVSLGAGLYEELLFRVLIVGGLMIAGRRLMGWGPVTTKAFAVLGGALVFAAFHYVGPYGDALELKSFVFRTVAGLAFSGLFVARGFGITAWTHSLYDVFLVMARSFT